MMCRYLTNLPTDTCNQTGLSKTLITRRETIRLKHLQKTLFVYKVFDDKELLDKISFMQFNGFLKYFEFLTNRLRGIYKITRDFSCSNADKIVKQRNDSFVNIIKMYKTSNPIVVLDFDKTITNKKFHSLYRWLVDEKIKIIINSANPSYGVIENYLINNNLPLPSKIYNNQGKKKKIVNLKFIAEKNFKNPLFYIDDEIEYITYANILFYQCYQYTNSGELLYSSLNLK